MSKEKELVKNTTIIFIGRFCTQFLSFLLLPLYTKLLNTKEFGTVDLIITYISLIIPCITLELSSALYRFLLDCRENKKESSKIISFVLTTVTIITFVFCIFFSLIANFLNFKYITYCILLIVTSVYSNIALQLARGFGNYVIYSITSIIIGSLTAALNVVLLVWMKTGTIGMLLSISCANLIGVIYALIKCKVWKYIKLTCINKSTATCLLKYSIPLISNSIIWWIINLSDRTLITAFLGVGANGIYAISIKFPNLIMAIYSVLNLAWQETVSSHINDLDSEEFINNMFNKLIEFFASLIIGMISVIWFIFPLIIDIQYIDSIKYIPILALGSFFNIFIGMIGTLYIGLKRTKEIAITSIMAGIINFLINICLIRHFGIYAAAISTLVAFFIMSIYRVISIKNYFFLKLNIRKNIIIAGIFSFEIYIFYARIQSLNIIGTMIAIIYAIIINYNMVKKIIIKKFDY